MTTASEYARRGGILALVCLVIALLTFSVTESRRVAGLVAELEVAEADNVALTAEVGALRAQVEELGGQVAALADQVRQLGGTPVTDPTPLSASPDPPSTAAAPPTAPPEAAASPPPAALPEPSGLLDPVTDLVCTLGLLCQ